MKKIFSSLAICMSCMFLMSSCFCDKVFVGDWSNEDTPVHVKSIHNSHSIGGCIVTHNNITDFVNDSKDYIIENKRTFGDLVVSSLTIGLYSPTTTKIYVKAANVAIELGNKKFGSKTWKGTYKVPRTNKKIQNITNNSSIDNQCNYINKRDNQRCQFTVDKNGKYCTMHKYMYNHR